LQKATVLFRKIGTFFGKTQKKKFVTRLLLEQTKKMANNSKIKGRRITLNTFVNYSQKKETL
jgi:hypothetical protein